jgi:hypothetical protein
VKQVVLYDQSGNFFVYWKPLIPPTNINFNVKLKCTNTPPCFFTINVNPGNVIQMNGGYLGVKIPSLPSTSSTVSLSIFPPAVLRFIAQHLWKPMDIITDNLDIFVANCDSDECLVSVNAWKNLKNLSNYTTSECGGAGGAVAASYREGSECTHIHFTEEKCPWKMADPNLAALFHVIPACCSISR